MNNKAQQFIFYNKRKTVTITLDLLENKSNTSFKNNKTFTKLDVNIVIIWGLQKYFVYNFLISFNAWLFCLKM